MVVERAGASMASYRSLMGLLRKLLGGTDATDRGRPAGLVHFDGPVVAGPSGRLYASAGCPYCGASLDPLPSRRRKCPHCGEEIVYAVTPDGIRFLHRIGDDLGLAREEAEAWAADNGYGAQVPVQPKPLRDVHRRQYQRAAALGLLVRITAGEEEPRTCAPCKALDGRTYPAAIAPVLPYEGCAVRYVCNCRSELLLPG